MLSARSNEIRRAPSAYFRALRDRPVPSRTEEQRLVRRIAESRHGLVAILVRCAVATRDLAELRTKLSQRRVSPWDVVLGTRRADREAKQRTRRKLVETLGRIGSIEDDRATGKLFFVETLGKEVQERLPRPFQVSWATTSTHDAAGVQQVVAIDEKRHGK